MKVFQILESVDIQQQTNNIKEHYNKVEKHLSVQAKTRYNTLSGQLSDAIDDDPGAAIEIIGLLKRSIGMGK